MPWKIEKDIRNNNILREEFMELAIKTFNLDFHNWWENGFWEDKYIPYVMTDGRQVIANVSVNIMDMVQDGEPKRYIQLGTVMTAPEFRRQGFSRQLMEAVLDDWKDRCSGVYLFANDSVLEFYPRFGFKKAEEYQVSLDISPKPGRTRRLDMSSPKDVQELFRYYKKGSPHSRFSMADNEGLLAFYCTGFLKGNVYILPEFDAAAVAERDGSSCICYDIFSDGKAELKDILEVLAVPETKRAVLGFTPKVPIGKAELLEEEDTTLFILDGKGDLLQGGRMMFPLLSHA